VRRRRWRQRFDREEIRMEDGQDRRGDWSWWYLLFLVEFVLVIWPAFYNEVEPSWIGLPFFYWYQLLCVLVAAVLTAMVYFATDRKP
jgi:Protein of unknown function (DUF3311)